MNSTELRSIIVEEISNVAPEVDAASVGNSEDLREALDLDSIDIFNVVVALSQRFKLDIPDADVPQLVTLAGGIAYLAKRLASAV